VKHPFTTDEFTIIRDLYPNMPTVKLAEMLVRSVLSIYSAANKLGVKKSAAYMSGPHACRLRQGVGVSSRFKPGFTPWNKGMKGLDLGGKETQFKPGTKPPNYKPIGSERLFDGYLQRKMTDTGYPPRDWRMVHVMLWEEKHGPFPAGHVVIFKDRNRANIHPDNLELVTRQELMLRNTYHRYPKEIALAMQLRSVLTRRINKLEKEAA
jgi:hypothetical protein